MDQAFAAIWNVLRADDPFRDYANDSELRIAIGHKLMNLVADGVTDPSRLRHLTIESLLLPGHWGAQCLAQASSDESFVHSQNLKHLPILPQSTLHTLTPQKDDAVIEAK
jgi:hypothetical protein